MSANFVCFERAATERKMEKERKKLWERQENDNEVSAIGED